LLVAIGDVFAQVPERRAAERVMLAAQAAARQQDGCLSYRFSEVLGDPGHYLLVGMWRDRPALDAHFRSASFAEYQATITPLLIRRSDLEVHVVAESTRPTATSVLNLEHDD